MTTAQARGWETRRMKYGPRGRSGPFVIVNVPNKTAKPKQQTCETCVFWNPKRRKESSYSVDWSLAGYCRRECAPTSSSGHCAAHAPITKPTVQLTVNVPASVTRHRETENA